MAREVIVVKSPFPAALDVVVEKQAIPLAGRVLRSILDEKELTMEAVARKAGMHISQVSRYLAKDKSTAIKVVVVERLAKAMDVHPAYVIERAYALSLRLFNKRYKGTKLGKLMAGIRRNLFRDSKLCDRK